MSRANKRNDRRKARVRRAIKASGRIRLSVFRSLKHIYVQVIDDSKGVTIASASTMDKDIASKLKYGGNKEAAIEVGKIVAERAKKAGVKEVVFDRGGYLYHGRVKALADSARGAGLVF